MSFINSSNGKSYAPGFFLAHEECVRETRQMAQNNYSVITEGETKHAPMGVAYPSNDSNAIGITYEDVDVTTGAMPASIVTKGIVYENRLAITGANYDSVTLKNLVSPKAQGWQERSGSSPDYTYADSTDTTVNTSKTYYLPDESHTAVSDYASVLNPQAEGWYERSGSSPNYVYTLSTDTEGDSSKTYYSKSDVRISDNAKTALVALGFKFVTEDSVVRPY